MKRGNVWGAHAPSLVVFDALAEDSTIQRAASLKKGEAGAGCTESFPRGCEKLHARTRPLPCLFLAQAALPEGFKPFAGGYEIPFLPLWAIIALTILATLMVVTLIWWLRKRWKKAHTPPPPPRQVAMNSLQELQPHIETDAPTEFTVEVATVLRRFVVGQYGIPATRQTSQEFLQSLTQSSAFSQSDHILLKSFLDKSDLIEFAKLQATSEDNRELWEKARQFVEGGQNQTIPGGQNS